MKTGIWIAAGLLAAGAVVYFLRFRKADGKITAQPRKENERHHLTNVFSRAKELSLGN